MQYPNCMIRQIVQPKLTDSELACLLLFYRYCRKVSVVFTELYLNSTREPMRQPAWYAKVLIRSWGLIDMTLTKRRDGFGLQLPIRL